MSQYGQQMQLRSVRRKTPSLPLPCTPIQYALLSWTDVTKTAHMHTVADNFWRTKAIQVPPRNKGTKPSVFFSGRFFNNHCSSFSTHPSCLLCKSRPRSFPVQQARIYTISMILRSRERLSFSLKGTKTKSRDCNKNSSSKQTNNKNKKQPQTKTKNPNNFSENFYRVCQGVDS